MNKNSEIIAKMTGIIYPIIIIFGFYIILNGHLTPGGGFQGGAVLASVFISRYLVRPISVFRIKSLQSLEKLLFIVIIALPILFVFMLLYKQAGEMNVIYLVGMNLLIGLKVCCGLTIIFFRFVYWESDD
ncbi:MnhB domain-containing protein [Mobilitalea sibirica]|uniref:MnhB domain-containing protein n=1 Tax=Mobilitalea sibirica TaxID=1462919 RepID=A0A8J7KZ46_9FIRM|nr:MnhB domain-containing protein [Mobilitalea sibirica]MBH1939348.1 MnhB domain-containing protein [Mobilitalea sibirica]